MNIVLLEQQDWIDEQHVELRDARLAHLHSVLRSQPGDHLKVGLLGGDRGNGEIVSLSKERACLRVTLDQAPLPRHPCTLVLALPRPKMLRRVLRTCAEFGVREIHLIHSYRVEKSFWQSPLLAPERIRTALHAGLERSGDTIAPRVQLHRRFRPFIEDSLEHVDAGAPAYCLHPGGTAALGADSGESSTLLIGPEGGFVPFELELMQANNVALRHLGSRILSVDTAVNTALARDLPR